MMTITLLKPGKNTVVTYDAECVQAAPGFALVRAEWNRPRADLGYIVFEPGDVFFEYFYAWRWYNVFEVRAASGVLKGWYCNVTRPAVIEHNAIISEDLELDLFVSADREQLIRLDEDEFEARGIAQNDPAAYAAALAALGELEYLARMAQPPFDGGITLRN